MSCIIFGYGSLMAAYICGASYSSNACDFVICTYLSAFCLIGDIYDLERFKEAFKGIFSFSSIVASFLLWTSSLVSPLWVLWTIFLMISVFFLSFFLSWMALYSISWSNFSYDSRTRSLAPKLYRNLGVDKFFDTLFVLASLIGEWISLLELGKFCSRWLPILWMMVSSYLIFCSSSRHFLHIWG